MTGTLRTAVKDFGDRVRFDVIAPGGFRILGALELAARTLQTELFITSGTDGTHSGPSDPHKRGEAFDVRSHNLLPELRTRVLGFVNQELGDGFYGFLESPNTANEHFHFQVRRFHIYPEDK